MQAILTDLRSAARSLAASRGVVAVSVLTLGAGLALCFTVLAAVNAYFVRALPYPEADRVHRIDYAAPGRPGPDFRALLALDWRALDDVIDVPMAWDLDVFYLLADRSASSPGGSAYPESVPGAWVTPGYMEGFGVRTALGRPFEPRDFEPANPAVAIISHRVWRTRFQGDPSIVGRTFTAYVSDRPDEPETFSIVGVLPEDLWHFNAYTEILAPLKAPSYPYQARLREGVSAEAAADRITAFVRGGVPSLPREWRVAVTGLHRAHVATVRPMLWSVGTGAALVLLIAGANVAVLLLVRGTRRQGELAVRRALGASQGRLARLLALEGLLIGAGATLAALLVSRLVISSIAPSVMTFFNRQPPGGDAAFVLEPWILIAASAGSLSLTLAFSLVPLVPLRAVLLSPMFSTARAATEPRGARRTRSILIGVEVAASLTLLAGAALMIQSAQRMLSVDFGIDADRVVTAGVSLRQRTYPDAAAQAAYFERLSARLEGVGGSASAAIGNWWPLQEAPARRLTTAGAAPASGTAGVQAVTGSYFDTIGIAIADGRVFDERDRADAEPVAVVSASTAARLWPGTRAVGQLVRIGPDAESIGQVAHRVIGVVGDVRQTHTDASLLDVYVALSQQPGRFAFVYLAGPRSPAWIDDLRAAVSSIDPESAVGAPRSLGEALDQERARPRFLAWLLSVFAVLASVLALVGVHGVIAYAARQRQREIAIRLAIGASAGAVTGLFVRQGGIVLGCGVVAGVAGAFGLGRLLETYLFGVAPAEPAIVATAAVLFGVVGLGAIWLPARRAASMNPTIALKQE